LNLSLFSDVPIWKYPRSELKEEYDFPVNELRNGQVFKTEGATLESVFLVPTLQMRGDILEILMNLLYLMQGIPHSRTHYRSCCSHFKRNWSLI